QQKVKAMTVDDESNLGDEEENPENGRENKRENDAEVDTEVDTEVDKGGCTVSGLCDDTNSSEPVYSTALVVYEEYNDDYHNNDMISEVDHEASEQ
ncbi:hypothetical protein BgiBS90_018664, partial [Biomphalaria glabrata]